MGKTIRNGEYAMLFLIILFSCNSVPAQVAYPDERIAALDEFLKEAQSQIGMPGVSCAIIENGEVIYKSESGLANIEHGVHITKNSIYPLYSLTKPFIAVGIFSLIEAGKLNLNDSVSKYVDEVPESWSKIKVKHLLSHSSGLPDMVGSNPYELRDLDENAAKKRVFNLPLKFNTGEKYEYNQTNFWLLMEIIEKITNKKLTDFIVKEQFPAAKAENVFFSSDAREIIKNRVTPYFPWIKGKLMIDLTYTNGDYFYACNGFHLTLNEFIGWDKRFQNNELISEDSKKRMWELFQYTSSDKTFTYGWEATELNDVRAFGFSGAMTTFYRIYPAKNISIIFLSNGFSNMYNQDAFTDSLIEIILK